MKEPRLDRPPLWQLRPRRPGTIDLEALYDAVLRICMDCPGHEDNKRNALETLMQLIEREEQRHPRKASDDEIRAVFERVFHRDIALGKFKLDVLYAEVAAELGLNKESIRRWHKRSFLEDATFFDRNYDPDIDAA